jgi:hypothetical protein
MTYTVAYKTNMERPPPLTSGEANFASSVGEEGEGEKV